MTARTRHGLTAEEVSEIRSAHEILQRYERQIMDALERDCNHPNSCPDVIEALEVMANAELMERI